MLRFKLKPSAHCATAILLLSGGAGQAADVSQDAVDACIDALRAEVAAAARGGNVLRTEFSEANSLVMLEDGSGATWRCLVSNDGRDPYLEREDGGTASASSAQSGPAYWEVRVSGTLNVHSSPSTAASVVAKLPGGTVVENRGCLDNEGRTWCEVADGDASGWAALEYLMPAAGSTSSYGEDTATADDGNGAMDGATMSGEPSTATEVVRFSAGSTGQEMSGTLSPGSSIRYILGASEGQDLSVFFTGTDAAVSYQIFNPDNSFLLDMISSQTPYGGQLWQSGDHVIEVINRTGADASYNIYMGVE